MNSSQANFPHAQTLLKITSHSISRRSDKEVCSRYYISSESPDKYPPEDWLKLIRGHWAGVEIRNHWKKDACLLEDKTRSKNPRIVANLILLRNALLKLFHHFADDTLSLMETLEAISLKPQLALNLISSKL